MKLNKKIITLVSACMMIAPVGVGTTVVPTSVQTVQAARLSHIKFNDNTQIVITKRIPVRITYTDGRESHSSYYHKGDRVSMYNYGTRIVTKQIAPSKFRVKDGRKVTTFTLKPGTYKVFQGTSSLHNADNYGFKKEGPKSIIKKANSLKAWAANYYKKHHIK